jgi:hypothetical protein
MKKTAIILMTLILIVSITYLLKSTYFDDDFNFSLRYNIDGKDFISTFDQTLTQDTVEGMMTIDFKLTKSDMKKIKNKIVALGIIEEDFRGLPVSLVNLSTVGKYDLKISLNGEIKNIHWTSKNARFVIGIEQENEDKYIGEYARVNKLFELKRFIYEIIITYDEFKNLPAHILYL